MIVLILRWQVPASPLTRCCIFEFSAFECCVAIVHHGKANLSHRPNEIDYPTNFHRWSGIRNSTTQEKPAFGERMMRSLEGRYGRHSTSGRHTLTREFFNIEFVTCHNSPQSQYVIGHILTLPLSCLNNLSIHQHINTCSSTSLQRMASKL